MSIISENHSDKSDLWRILVKKQFFCNFFKFFLKKGLTRISFYDIIIYVAEK